MIDFIVDFEAMTKADQKTIIDDLSCFVDESSIHSAIEMYVKLRALQEVIKGTMATIEQNAIEEAENYKGDAFKGVKIVVRNAVPMYDYSVDEEWVYIKEQEDIFSKMRKTHEKFLKGLNATVDNMETGEMSTPPTIKSWRKSSIALTFPKD